MKPLMIVLGLSLFALSKVSAAEGSPEQQVVALFKQLTSEKRSTAFQDFFGDGLAGKQKPAEIKAMDAQAAAAWQFYGLPESYEIIQRTEIGESLFRIKWLTKHKEEAPLFWSALFYRRSGMWEPFTVLFFDDPHRAGILNL